MSESTKTIFDKATCMNITIGAFRVSCKADLDSMETDADKDRLSAKKSKLQSEILDTIYSRHAEIRKYIHVRCLPNTHFKTGTYIVPDKIWNHIIEYLHEQRKALIPMIEAFVAEYREAYVNGFPLEREALKSQFNEADYPTPTTVRSRFTIDWASFTYDAPGKLKILNEELFLEEKEKIKEQGRQTLEALKMGIRVEFVKSVDHMVDKLSASTGTGKKKSFKNSSIEGFKQWLNFFEDKNIAEDEELSRLVGLARDCLEGIDPDQLRSDEGLRSVIAQSFSEIRLIMDESIKTTGRAFVIEEEK